VQRELQRRRRPRHRLTLALLPAPHRRHRLNKRPIRQLNEQQRSIATFNSNVYRQRLSATFNSNVHQQKKQ
jgi:hypothetical protein